MFELFKFISNRARFSSQKQRGATLVEYALIIAVIAIAAIVALGTLSGGINELFTDAANELPTPAAEEQ